MNSLERCGLQAILNRAESAKEHYEDSNRASLTETEKDTAWGCADTNISEAISLLKMALAE